MSTPTIASIGPQTEVVTYTETVATLPSATLVATDGSGSIGVTVSSIDSTHVLLTFATVPTTGKKYTLTLTGGTASDGSTLPTYTTIFIPGLSSGRGRFVAGRGRFSRRLRV